MNPSPNEPTGNRPSKSGDVLPLNDASLPSAVSKSGECFIQPSIEVVEREYADSRGLPAHKAIDLTVTLAQSRTVSEVLSEMLRGPPFRTLTHSWWHGGCPAGASLDALDEPSPMVSRITLFMDSRGLSKDEMRTCFQSSGLTCARAIEAAIVCAAMIRRAESVGLNLDHQAHDWRSFCSGALEQLTESEIRFLTILRSGVVRLEDGGLRLAIRNGHLSFVGESSLSDFGTEKTYFGFASPPTS
jgi:hypothetical protein